MKTESICKSCSFRGYSAEVCSLHHRFMDDDESGLCPKWWPSGEMRKKYGKKLALGACAGLLATAAGLSAAWVIGLKGLCETYLAGKVVASGGVAGAVTGLAVRPKASPAANGKKQKRKHFVPPLYLNGS